MLIAKSTIVNIAWGETFLINIQCMKRKKNLNFEPTTSKIAITPMPPLSLSSLSFVSLTLFDTFSCNMKLYNTFFERKQKVPFLFFENSLSMTFVSLQHCIYVFWRAYPISCMFIWFSHALRNSTASWTSNLKKECTKKVMYFYKIYLVHWIIICKIKIFQICFQNMIGSTLFIDKKL